jgi:hypothetical protein
MKPRSPKLFFLSFLFLLFSSAGAQDLTGIWKGYFITEDGEQYKLEFQVEQQPAYAVSGVSYSYLDTRFYGKSLMKGKYSRLNKVFRIEETRTVEVKSNSGGTCLMNYTLTFTQSGKEQFLEGTYLGKSENRKDPSLNGKWGDCGGGRVFLRRVETSDFYVEPFLKEKPQKQPAPDVNKETKSAVTTQPKTSASAKKQPAVTQPKKNTVTKTPTEKPGNNTVTTRKRTGAINGNEKSNQQDVKILPKIIPAPVQTRARENEMVKTITVHSGEITIKLYDNGEVDGDTISVYVDNRPVLSNKGLSTSPIVLNVKFDELSPEHTVIMVAENLGRIPPNTSLMIINDGDKRYQVNITSTEQKNAMVRFRFEKPE